MWVKTSNGRKISLVLMVRDAKQLRFGFEVLCSTEGLCHCSDVCLLSCVLLLNYDK